MAFVLIATGASSRSRVRTLSLRPLLGVALVGALTLLGAGGGLGYWLAEPAPVQAPVAGAAAVPALTAHPFTLEQVGALSARLFRLESEAAQLGRRIGVLQKEPASSSSPSGALPRREPLRQETAGDAAVPAGASGGPWLPSRSASAASMDALDGLDEQLVRVETMIASIADATVRRSLELMRLPTRLPILGAELSSSFGNRSDPVPARQCLSCRSRLRGRAWHADHRGGGRHGRLRRLEERLRLHRRDRSRQRPRHPLRARLEAAGAGGPGRRARRPHRPRRLDRPLDRSAPALRGAAQRPPRRSEALPGRPLNGTTMNGRPGEAQAA
jgi:hypothetical protein